MVLHPNFPESPHEIIDIAQGIPPFNLLGVLDIHCAPLERRDCTYRPSIDISLLWSES